MSPDDNRCSTCEPLLSSIQIHTPTILQVLEAGREDGGFRLRGRALHVYEEAQRVRDFKAICDLPNQAGAGDGVNAKLQVRTSSWPIVPVVLISDG